MFFLLLLPVGLVIGGIEIILNLEADRTELHNLAAQHPERVTDMKTRYEAWAQRCGVIAREKILQLMKDQKTPPAFWEEETVAQARKA